MPSTSLELEETATSSIIFHLELPWCVKPISHIERPQAELLQEELPQVMVSKPQVFFPILPISMALPIELVGLQWCLSPLFGTSSPEPMHNTSITLRSFPTSLERHRNKPHSIWSLDAPGIITNIFTPELFMVYQKVPSF
jgi:hypothetical protein